MINKHLKALTAGLIGILAAGHQTATTANNWAYELSDNAIQIYMDKATQIPCSQIGKLLDDKDSKSIYVAIRDAGLFSDRSCAQHFAKYHQRLEQMEGVRDALAFYRFRMGDKSQLNVLAKSFDRDARKSGDHWTIDIFGFLGDWGVSGSRLVRHTQYADGAAAELLCSALKWRRYLYGEVDFEKNWFRVGKVEGVLERNLIDRYQYCHPYIGPEK